MEKELAVLKAEMGFVTAKLNEVSADVKTLLQNQQCNVHQERMTQLTQQQKVLADEIEANKADVEQLKNQGFSTVVKVLFWIFGTAAAAGITIAGWFIVTVVPHILKGGS